MKTIAAGMQALFAARKFYTAKLFTFTLQDGTALRYCSGDIDLVLGGHTYSCGGQTGPFWERSGYKAQTHWGLGTSVDSMTFDALPGSGTVEGFPFLLAVRYGLFDGADFTYQRINMGSPGDTSAGAILMFGGRVAQVDYSNTVATFTVNSYLELLNFQLPRNIYQAGCLNTLFDASCGLSQSSFPSGGTVSVPGLPYAFDFTGVAAGQPANFFNLGKVQFTSGKNAGLWSSVQSHSVGGGISEMAVFPPFPFAPQAGDTFVAYPGCDKQQVTCTAKFANGANFRAFPFTPQAETAL